MTDRVNALEEAIAKLQLMVNCGDIQLDEDEFIQFKKKLRDNPHDWSVGLIILLISLAFTCRPTTSSS